MISPRRVYTICVLAVALWCSLILLAPVSRLAGLPPDVTTLLYGTFSRVCHQFPDRSLHLGGEPLGVCTRCSAIYFSFFAAMLFLPFAGLKGGEIPPRWILIVGMLPMAADVALSLSGISPSTTATRLLTGFLAGGILPFFVLPPFLAAIGQLLAYSGDPRHERQTE